MYMSRFIRRYYSSTNSPLSVFNLLKERGLLDQCTNISEEDQKFLSAPCRSGSPMPPSVYVGFDPTADSLHVGNLLSIIALLHFQRAGYQPLALVGGATGIIGDPSGRTKERSVMAQEVLQNNIRGISDTLTRIGHNVEELNTGNDTHCLPIKVLNNAEWYKDMTVIDFMSNIGRHFNLSSMLRKESVQQRLDSQESISFTEFSYQIFQSFDFQWLSNNHNCWLQIGGGDQWGNITAGCSFIHKCSGRIAHALTVPLVTNSLGEKMGKSAGNAVWLSSEKTSPYHLYQYFFNTTDADVEKCLKYFTFIPVKDINEICAEHKAQPEHRNAQKILAENVTMLIHGEKGVVSARNATAALFGDQHLLRQMIAPEIEQLLQEAPSCTISKDVFSSNPTVVDILVEAGAVPSRNQARKLIESGGIYINNARIDSDSMCISHDSHVIDGRVTLIRKGKRSYTLIKWTD